jgi:proteasome lid subunit RPN8/RPN11
MGREYLLEDPEVERGCLITQDMQIVPFKNVAKQPVARIEMAPEGFLEMARLYRESNLYGWLHSHPHWQPYPSITDVAMHNLPISMIIYSVPEDKFAEYTKEEMSQIRDAMTDASLTAPSIVPSKWKPTVYEMHKDKELISL